MFAAAAERGISTEPLRFICDYSELALPKLVEEGEQYDVAFIDGCHNWPAVFVDFCYMNMLLPAGGTILLDDLHLYSVAELFNFLRRQEQLRVRRARQQDGDVPQGRRPQVPAGMAVAALHRAAHDRPARVSA